MHFFVQYLKINEDLLSDDVPSFIHSGVCVVAGMSHGDIETRNRVKHDLEIYDTAKCGVLRPENIGFVTGRRPSHTS